MAKPFLYLELLKLRYLNLKTRGSTFRIEIRRNSEGCELLVLFVMVERGFKSHITQLIVGHKGIQGYGEMMGK